MKSKKKILIIILLIVETIVLFGSLLYSLSIFLIKDNKTVWFDEESPDGKHHVKCYTVGTPLFFSSQELLIYFNNTASNYEKETNSVSFSTELANDGANLYDDNYQIEWLEDSVKIIFRGEETGGDNTFIIPYYKNDTAEQINNEEIKIKYNEDHGQVFGVSSNKLEIGYDQNDINTIELSNNLKIIDYETEKTLSLSDINRGDFVTIFTPTEFAENEDTIIIVTNENFVTEKAEDTLLNQTKIDTLLVYYNEEQKYVIAGIDIGQKVINKMIVRPIYYLELVIGGVTESYLGNKDNPVQVNYDYPLNELCRIELVSGITYLPSKYIIKTIEFIAD